MSGVSSSSSSVGPVAKLLQPGWLIVHTPHPTAVLVWTFPRSPPGTATSPTTREILVAKGGRELAGNFAWNCDFHVNSGIFYMPQICDMGPTALLPFRRKACWGFFRPEKSWRLRPGLNPRTWVLKDLDHRSRLDVWCIFAVFVKMTLPFNTANPTPWVQTRPWGSSIYILSSRTISRRSILLMKYLCASRNPSFDATNTKKPPTVQPPFLTKYFPFSDIAKSSFHFYNGSLPRRFHHPTLCPDFLPPQPSIYHWMTWPTHRI